MVKGRAVAVCKQSFKTCFGVGLFRGCSAWKNNDIKKEFNIFVSFIDITAMEIDKISDGYRNLKAITQDVMLATVQAETQAKIKKIVMEQDAEIENYAKLLEIDREEIKNNPKLKKVVRLTALFGIIAVGAIIALLIILL